jgi:hypothetical protein
MFSRYRFPVCRPSRRSGSLHRSIVLTATFASICLSARGTGRPDANGVPEKPAALTSYAARTDRRIEAYPTTLPPLGPAGSVFTDPTFGSRMTRVTDEGDSRKPGQSFHTPSSAQANIWNSTSTKFYVVETGGRLLLYDFDGSKMKARFNESPDLGWNPEVEFSYQQPNILYGLRRDDPVFEQYDVVTRKVATVHNPKDCLKLSSGDHGADISTTADDRRFMGVFGPRQGDNYIAYVYDRDKGCRWFNTKTGEVGGQWGPKGKISGAESFGIHDARISKGGDFVVITGGGQGPVVWDVATLNAVLCTLQNPMACGGHHAIGYSLMVNPSRMKHPMELLVRPLNHLEKTSQLIPELKDHGVWFDKHLSWNNADAQDTNPVCLSTYTPANPSTERTPLTVDQPWVNEIDCIEMDGKGSKVWRFAHTYSTAKNGFWSTPRGNVSQDGRFYAFTSDWENTLGKARGQGYRHDVFVVELK